jgi:feruloyl-CoA synthase
MTSLASLLDQHARTNPRKQALRAAGQSWTYAELAEQTRRAASVLRARGVGAGDRVALVNFNTVGFVFALFGAWRLGAVAVPINHKSPAPEVGYMLAHSGARLCVVDGALAPMAGQIGHAVDWLATDGAAPGVPLLEDLIAQAEPLPGPYVPDGGALAEILYTSGTTGKPKGCLHSHDNVFHAALCASASNCFTPGERTLIAMPIWHSSPLNNWLMGTLLVGGTVVLMREYAPKPFLEVMAAERISFTFGAPIAFLAPLAAVPDLAAYDLSHMRQCAYGGGPLGADMARKLARSYRTDRFVQVYGMTESGPLGTVLYPEDAEAKAGSIGRGVPGVEVEVRHPDGRLCGPGDVGEIHLRSPAMMLGYLDDPEATAEAIDAEGWYRSGDLARLDEDGYMFIVDRLKDMIITGGENVYSKEVEDALGPHPAVLDVAVVGRAHPEWGETVVAVLTVREGQPRPADAELRAWLEPRLARYKIPRVYEWRDALPRTPTGKILKHPLC